MSSLDKALLLKMHHLMVKSRVLEERLIKIYKSGQGYFWIGGPGEEGFGVPLGLLVHKGSGTDYDYLHLHYRALSTLLAMGMPYQDAIRLMMNKKTDIQTGGRLFVAHHCIPQWNVMPITSPIAVQYSLAIGRAWVQHRKRSNGITVVTGGDAGTAEGDFATCLIWSSRPKNQLPILIIVQNNRWGISTAYETQHGEEKIIDRGKAFGIRSVQIDGLNPIECFKQLKCAFDYVRKQRKPVLAEVEVSRMYGHSSASGANLDPSASDPLKIFEKSLLKMGIIKEVQIKALYKEYNDLSLRVTEQVRLEANPSKASIWNHIYHHNENAHWRHF